MASNNNIIKKKAKTIADYIDRDVKINDEIKELTRKLNEAKANKQKSAKKNREYIAIKTYELFFDETQLGKIFEHNKGEIFRDEIKVERLIEIFEEVSQKIFAEPEIFGLDPELKGNDTAEKELGDSQADKEKVENYE